MSRLTPTRPEDCPFCARIDSLEELAPGLFAAVVVPAMSDPGVRLRRQAW